MYEKIVAILTSIDFWKIAAPAFVAILVWALNERSKRKLELWQIKKDACLKALNLANAVLSNYKYENLEDDAIVKQYVAIDEARACFNELACTCDSSGVLEQLKRIVFDKEVSIDAIVDLRNAVRRELKFSNDTIDNDRKKAFLSKINCEKPT